MTASTASPSSGFRWRASATPRDFARRSSFVFEHQHSLQDELSWLDSQGPVSPGLAGAASSDAATEFDFVRRLQPPLLHGLSTPPALSRGPGRARADHRARPGAGPGDLSARRCEPRARSCTTRPKSARSSSGWPRTREVPGVTVGVGSRRAARAPTPGARGARFGLANPFIVYVGRIDANKGCEELFDYFTRFCARTERPLDLVLIGTPALPIPAASAHPAPGLRQRRRTSSTSSPAAEALVMPSPFESLSMVALEAWALGRPVLANGRCDVLVGPVPAQQRRPVLSERTGVRGDARDPARRPCGRVAEWARMVGAFYAANYAWPVIEGKYLSMFDRLTHEPARAAAPSRPPGWFARRRRRLPPAAAVVAAVPTGPVRGRTDSSSRPS